MHYVTNQLAWELKKLMLQFLTLLFCFLISKILKSELDMDTCVCVCSICRGYPISIILPLVPCAFGDGTPVTGPRSLLGGYPSPRWGENTPFSGGGNPVPWGVSQSQTDFPGQGYPPQLGQDWVNPPPKSEQDWLTHPPPRIGLPWTGYAVAGMPIAVSRRRTVLV